eukprot:7377585-Prymnesium_polylepis.2
MPTTRQASESTCRCALAHRERATLLPQLHDGDERRRPDVPRLVKVEADRVAAVAVRGDDRVVGRRLAPRGAPIVVLGECGRELGALINVRRRRKHVVHPPGVSVANPPLRLERVTLLEPHLAPLQLVAAIVQRAIRASDPLAHARDDFCSAAALWVIGEQVIQRVGLQLER